MTSNCEGYFQRLQELEQTGNNLRKAAADLRRRPPTWAMEPNATPDAAWAAAFEKAMARLNSDEVQALIGQALEQGAPTRIAEDQMLPVNWLLARRDAQTVEDYAQLSQLVIGGQDAVDPAFRAELGKVYGPEEIASLVAKSYQEFLRPDGRLLQLGADVAPFLTLVERMTRLRVAFEGFRGNYLARVYEMANTLEAGGSITSQQRRGLLDAWKLAMAGEAHFDLARRRTGQTLRSLQDDPEISPAVLENQELYLATDESLLPSPEDAMAPGSHVAQVARTVADAQVNPQRASRKLRSLAAAAKAVGLDPGKRLKTEGDFFDFYLRMSNSLAKDSMLANSNSQWLNLGSNMFRAFEAPLRLAVENGYTAQAYGTKLNRSTRLEGMQIAWKGFGEALALTRIHAKALWLDSFWDGMTAYGGQLDAYKRSAFSGEAAALGRARVEVGLNEKEVGEWQARLMAKAPAPNLLNPWHLYRQMHWTFGKGQAGLRLFLHEQFGVPVAWLKPGFRLMAATDNVAGYLFRALKVRNELHMKARYDPELNLKGPEARERWVDEQFAMAFRGIDPTEREVRRWRQDRGLGPEVTDEEVFEQILAFRDEQNQAGLFSFQQREGAEETARVEYGIAQEESPIDAAGREFSEEMRFQNQIKSPAVQGLMAARKSWWVDQQFPFVQAPLMGTLLDWDMAIGPVKGIVGLGRWERMTPKQKGRMMSAWVTSNVLLGMFIALDAADGDRDDLIVGNGPPAGPEREAWLTKIRAAGRQPNTIAGVPVAGFPFLNTLMLWRDFKDAMTRSAVSNYDQATILTGLQQLLTGALLRTPGVGQFRTMMNLLQNTSAGAGERLRGFAAFQQGSFGIPFIGAVRQAARIGSGGVRYEPYQSGALSPQERAAELDGDALEKIRNGLGSALARIWGTTPPLLGYAVKETDWLGNPIRMPWGMTAVDALKDYAFPQAWPDGEVKLYAQLDALDRLQPPRELMTRRLDGVAMSGELQREYVQIRSQVVGGDAPLAEMEMLKIAPTVNMPFGFQVETDRAGVQGEMTNLGKDLTIPLGMVAADAIRGRTEVEAYRALFNDPRWKALMANPATTADVRIKDQPQEAIKRTPSMRVLDSIREYYGMRTRQELRRSTSPAAKDWQTKRLVLNDQEARNRNSTEAVMETVRALSGR